MGSKATTIWTMSKYPVQKLVPTFNEGFVVVEVNELFCGCYASPRWSLEHDYRADKADAGGING